MAFWENQNEMPEMPEDEQTWKKMVFNAVFNHIPSRLRFQDIKINFLIMLLGVIIGLLAVICSMIQ